VKLIQHNNILAWTNLNILKLLWLWEINVTRTIRINQCTYFGLFRLCMEKNYREVKNNHFFSFKIILISYEILKYWLLVYSKIDPRISYKKAVQFRQEVRWDYFNNMVEINFTYLNLTIWQSTLWVHGQTLFLSLIKPLKLCKFLDFEIRMFSMNVNFFGWLCGKMYSSKHTSANVANKNIKQSLKNIKQ